MLVHLLPSLHLTAGEVAAWLAVALLWGWCCALVGTVWAVVLPMEDTPLDGLFRRLQAMHDSGGWRSWVAGPLGACAKCCSGQLALWSSALLLPAPLLVLPAVAVTAAASAVLFATATSNVYRWLKNKI